MGALLLFFTPCAYAGGSTDAAGMDDGAGPGATGGSEGSGPMGGGASCLARAASPELLDVGEISEDQYATLTQTYNDPEAGLVRVVSDTLFILYQAGTTLEQREDLCQRWGFVFYDEDIDTGWALASYGLDLTVEEAVAAMKQEPIVADAEPDFILDLHIVPNDPYMVIQPYPTEFQYYWYKVRAPQGWDVATGYYGTPSIIMDTGFDRPVDKNWRTAPPHQDFAAYYSSKFWRGVSCVSWQSGRPPKWYTECEWGRYEGDWRCPEWKGNCYLMSFEFPCLGARHGTCVTGVFGADTNNAVGIAGGTWHATIFPVRLAHLPPSACTPPSATCLSMAAVWHALVEIKRNWGDIINTINMSFGGPARSQALDDAIRYLENARFAVVVASAGNQATSTLQYPAAYSSVLSVGGLYPKHPFHDPTTNDCRINFSNYGSWVRSSAYAGDIRSTDIQYPCKDLPCSPFGHPYAVANGTSFAAPMVAALAHLVKFRFDWWDRPDRVKEQIIATSEPYPSSSVCPAPGLPKGRIDYCRALAPASCPLP